MAEIVATFFNIIGVDLTPPATMSELIPYLLVIFVGIILVVAVFRVIGGIAHALIAVKRV